jgi:hypothetical protein
MLTGVLKVSPLTSISTVFPFAHNGTDTVSENNRQKAETTRLRISPPVQPAARHYINRAVIGSIQLAETPTFNIQPERDQRSGASVC